LTKFKQNTITYIVKKHSESSEYLRQKRTQRVLRRMSKSIRESEEEDSPHKKSTIQVRLQRLEHFCEIIQSKLDLSKYSSELVVQVPSNFSLYERTAETLQLIGKIAQIKYYDDISGVIIDYRRCKNNDLAAENLLADTIKAIKEYKKQNSLYFSVKGNYPQKERIKRLIRSIGVVKETASQRYHLQGKEKDELRIFRRQSDINEESDIFGKDKKTRATEDFTDHLDDCLKFIQAKLDEDERDKLEKYLGEVLGNAEDHSGTRIWTILGYFDAFEPNKKYSEIVITSVGKTIFETFEEKKNVPIVYEDLEQYVDRHKGKSFSKEQLCMVYSMQKNVSSKKDESVDRGQGTWYLIDLFHHLASECERINDINGQGTTSSKPRMTIISGSSALMFNEEFDPSKGGKTTGDYAFNTENDLSQPPSKNFVKRYKDIKFPGTIIYIKFPIYEQLLAAEDDN